MAKKVILHLKSRTKYHTTPARVRLLTKGSVLSEFSIAYHKLAEMYFNAPESGQGCISVTLLKKQELKKQNKPKHVISTSYMSCSGRNLPSNLTC